MASGNERRWASEIDTTGISGKLILEWVNLADLMRIKGVGSELSDLLEEAGVDTVRELAGRVPANLHEKLVDINGRKKLVRQLPSLSQVETWVAVRIRLIRIKMRGRISDDVS